ncbi:hypothetical protein Ahy_A06g029382 [Arachis hypogaea]|uniref:Uncharacterized protein n=1 Tax=Arachis hypogaea TaxID=3818 RepID=A0A445CTB0_ARAHY|nr:hypothetical protein Ahy_A06g029382 [Arachis hypogaea]
MLLIEIFENIPEALTDLSNLTILDLSANNFSGKIPSNLSMIPGLVYFNVSGNNFDGNKKLCGKPLDRKCEEMTKQQHRNN